MHSRHRHVGLAVAAALCLAVASASAVVAHTEEEVGSYHLLIGWDTEPTYVGQPNAVQLTIHDAAGEPVTDMAEDDLHVVVSTGGQDSPPLSFEPAFDVEERFGVPGQYVAAILPTAPGDYTFHFTGKIRDQSVDLTVDSGDETFSSVIGTSDVEFPTKLPAMVEVVTRLDRIDARITDLQGAAGPTQADVEAAQASAADARAAADRALFVGAGLGILGTILAVAALAAVQRRGPPMVA